MERSENPPRTTPSTLSHWHKDNKTKNLIQGMLTWLKKWSQKELREKNGPVGVGQPFLAKAIESVLWGPPSTGRQAPAAKRSLYYLPGQVPGPDHTTSWTVWLTGQIFPILWRIHFKGVGERVQSTCMGLAPGTACPPVLLQGHCMHIEVTPHTEPGIAPEHW